MGGGGGRAVDTARSGLGMNMILCITVEDLGFKQLDSKFDPHCPGLFRVSLCKVCATVSRQPGQ